DLRRLSICLVGREPVTRLGAPGVAATSPIATPIEMVDFDRDPTTVEGLARGFPGELLPDAQMFHRVLELSGGQPLVTMELLREARHRECRTSESIERLAHEM